MDYDIQVDSRVYDYDKRKKCCNRRGFVEQKYRGTENKNTMKKGRNET